MRKATLINSNTNQVFLNTFTRNTNVTEIGSHRLQQVVILFFMLIIILLLQDRKGQVLFITFKTTSQLLWENKITVIKLTMLKNGVLFFHPYSFNPLYFNPDFLTPTSFNPSII